MIAKNAGIDIGNPLESLQGQHYIKLALDDALNSAQQQGIGKVEQSAISNAKSAFVSEIERQNPSYAAARTSFRDMSQPINQMQVGQGLLGRVGSPLVDSMGNPVITPNSFA